MKRSILGLALSAFIALTSLTSQPAYANEASPTAVYLQELTGSKAFTACGKEWLRGKNNVSWQEANQWVQGLGNGWRVPTKSELRAMFTELRETSPLGAVGSAWASLHTDGRYWFESCSGNGYGGPKFESLWAVAVRK